MNIRVLTETQGCTPDSNEILVGKNSPIQRPQNLAGKTVAANILNNIQTLTADNVLSADGVNIKSIHYIVVPFPSMGAAVESGKVDAAYMLEPFVTEAEQQYGEREVLDACADASANLWWAR